MKRRDFLKILSAIPAVLAVPAFAKNNRFADYDLISGYRDDAADFARVSALAMPNVSDANKVRLHFKKVGYPDFTKIAMLTSCQQAVNPSGGKSEMAYQIVKRCEEAHRDYLYSQYGSDWRKHETAEHKQNQMTVFMRDLEKFNL